MNETGSNNGYEDPETNFGSIEYAFNIEALKEHYDASHQLGKNALKNTVNVESSK